MFFAGGAFVRSFVDSLLTVLDRFGMSFLNPVGLLVTPLVLLLYLMRKWKNRRTDEKKKGLHAERDRNYVVVIVTLYALFLAAYVFLA